MNVPEMLLELHSIGLCSALWRSSPDVMAMSQPCQSEIHRFGPVKGLATSGDPYDLDISGAVNK